MFFYQELFEKEWAGPKFKFRMDKEYMANLYATSIYFTKEGMVLEYEKERKEIPLQDEEYLHLYGIVSMLLEDLTSFQEYEFKGGVFKVSKSFFKYKKDGLSYKIAGVYGENNTHFYCLYHLLAFIHKTLIERDLKEFEGFQAQSRGIEYKGSFIEYRQLKGIVLDSFFSKSGLIKKLEFSSLVLEREGKGIKVQESHFLDRAKSLALRKFLQINKIRNGWTWL